METHARLGADLEVLSRSVCLDLLGSVDVGRVVVSLAALPAIVPVPMALDGQDVVFAVPPGGDLEQAVVGAVVALEADVLDRLAGWSVVVTGQVTALSDGAPAPAGPWPSGYRLCRLTTELISGRRLANPAIHVSGTVSPAMASAVNRHADTARSLGFGSGGTALAVDECNRLLAAEEVGRLAVVVDGQPLVFPVNYVVDGETVVFRTAAGTKLEAISRSLATFEVDRWAPDEAVGWAVVVEGFAVEVTDVNNARLLEQMAALPLFPWVPGARSHLVRVLPVSVSGTRWQREAGTTDEPPEPALPMPGGRP